MEDLKKKIGLRFKHIRKNRGLTQAALAELIDRSEDSIYAIERGATYPGFETLNRVCEKLSIEIKEFFVFSDSEKDLRRTSLMFHLVDAAEELDNKTLVVAVEQVKMMRQLSKKKKLNEH